MRLPSHDLTGTDFTGYSLAQADLRLCDLTDCVMPANCANAIFTTCRGTNVDFSTNQSILTGARFSTSDISSFNFVGAYWGGKVLVRNPTQWQAGDYWVMQTDDYAEIGCMQQTIQQWNAYTNQDRLGMDDNDPTRPNTWWLANAETLNARAASWIVGL